jgi:Ca2+-binding RTX toxin-like protein
MNRRLLAIALAAPLAISIAGPAFASGSGGAAGPERCHGRAVTMVITAASPHVVTGSDRSDVVLMKVAGHVLNTRGGNDDVCGSAGADVIDTGDGNDTVTAGGGNDRISGGRGSDHLAGDAGDDQISGGDGNDVESGGAGNDVLRGDAGDDTLTGDRGRDHADGGSGRNRVAEGRDDSVVRHSGDSISRSADDGPAHDHAEGHAASDH